MIGRMILLLCLALLWSQVSSSDDDCCLCGPTCPTVVYADTLLFAEKGGSGSCSQLEWYLLSKLHEGDKECTLYQDMFGKVCCTQVEDNTFNVAQQEVRKLQWNGGHFIANTHTWEEEKHTSTTASSSYENWNSIMAQQRPTPTQYIGTTSAPKRSKPLVTNTPQQQQSAVQVIQTSPANQPPMVNSWGNANQLSAFDRCMIYNEDNSVSTQFCSICAQPTNYARGVVVNNKIAGGDIAFTASCGNLNTAFKCANIQTNHQMCGIAVYGYANQCGCREFDNNSEEFFGFDQGNDTTGQWVAWTPGSRPSG